MDIRIGGAASVAMGGGEDEGTAGVRARKVSVGNAVEAYRQDPGGGGPSVAPVYSDGFVKVLSEDPVSEATAKAFAARIEAAWNYDLQKQKWGDDGAFKKPLSVIALSGPSFESFTGDASGSIGGVTISPDVFVVPERVMSGRKTAQDEDTIAHELGHVQDLRQAGERIKDVPIYLQEGKEYLLGDGYPNPNPHLKYVADALMKVDAQLADDVMHHFRTVNDEAKSGPMGFYGETVGALYVEWLRTWAGGKGFPDAIHRVATTVEKVGGGESYDAAFKSEFGMTPAESEKQFVSYIARTEDDRKARFSGTIYDVG
ncbi:MAG: hypothetical protein ACJ790_13990 [Myxococcaceae bacterium]